MKTTQDINFPDFYYHDKITHRKEMEAYEAGRKRGTFIGNKTGQKEMLEKVLEVTKQWEKGQYSNSEYRKILTDFYNEFYGKRKNN